MDRLEAIQQGNEWMQASSDGLDPFARMEWINKGLAIQSALNCPAATDGLWLNNADYTAYKKECARLDAINTFYLQNGTKREKALGFEHDMSGGFPAEVLADPEWQFYRTRERAAFKAIQNFNNSAEGKAGQRLSKKLLPDMASRMAQLQVYKAYRDNLDISGDVMTYNPDSQMDSAAHASGYVGGSKKDYMITLLENVTFKHQEIQCLVKGGFVKYQADCYGGLALVRIRNGASNYSIYFANPFYAGEGCKLITDGFLTRQAAQVAIIRLAQSTNAASLNSGSATAMNAAASRFNGLLKAMIKSKAGVMHLVDPFVGLTFSQEVTYDSASGLHSDGESIATKGALIAVLDSAVAPVDMVLYHGSNSPDEITEIKSGFGDGIDFGGMFMSTDKDTAASHGQYIYESDINPADVLTQQALETTLDPETVKAALLAAMPSIDPENVDQVDQAWRAVILEDMTAITADFFGVDNEADAMWTAQSIRGQVAKALGYKAVEMNDEHGTSYLVFAGVPIKALNAPTSSAPVENDLQWLDDAYADPSSLLDPAAYGAFMQHAATDERVVSETAVRERYNSVIAAAYKQMVSNGVSVGSDVTMDSDALAGQALNDDWITFADGYNSLKIPRVQMPQVKHCDHDDLIDYLANQSITHEAVDIPAQELYPTQLEFSPAKVEKAKQFMSESTRPLLVSSCNHVVDGHHVYVACYDDNQTMSTIRFNAPILELLEKIKTYPKVTDSLGQPFTAATSHEAGNVI